MNTYSDIIKQVHELQEEFSNLFERKDWRSASKSHACAIGQLCAADKKGDIKGFNKALHKMKKAEAEENRLAPPPSIEEISNAPEYVYTSKGFKKMNDNNSLNELMAQIMDLKEQYTNLFEVEVGSSASSEVPPSTNKLKRDVKTKDGKVELVSVENELFPYEGNKKDQFQQKVLDTINGMIQGTKTLEDLLQVVRQKQAPLKEN